MLTDSKLKSLKPQDKIYRVADRDGIYVTVAPSGSISFRLDHRINGRRESLTLGRYGTDGITLVRARELAMTARKDIREGRSPMIERRRTKAKQKDCGTFGEWANRGLDKAVMAESTRAMRRGIYQRDVARAFQNRQLHEIEPQDIRIFCEGIVARGAPATAIHVRDQVKQVFVYARALRREDRKPRR
ncbi:tyrosine-type recombinase/integrase [Caulobacter sp. DWR1-3-2b1]|uniref:tyrosine-type recombinase/integrase n=1 Tax=Caulobacter sp. DWR1-3-2b1 TaxID=2804670 RepID=UPI003CECBC26